ncbi:thyroid transcription factor 1-associated protein 26 homolog [Thalassophryne amazonica]|uniref:thyroid transcription factor 1-associated protein 26 homolog n=1 Tax=Thalassophryne amazonica TaxID=390379 RepID=UPI001470D56D|nr:thyroid transcription factor 1-associated protein 26 homolog [Thalassophryne amazonica]
MAPTELKTKTNKFSDEDAKWKKSRNRTDCVKKKRKWIPEQKVFKGSVKEGQGFAFKRKQKVKHEYNKLLRKEKKRNPESKRLYRDEYPEHLKHLYTAEAEKLKNEAWANRVNRSKMRVKVEEEEGDKATARQSEVGDPDSGNTADFVTPAATQSERLPVSNRMKRKMQKTSYQKTKEELERIREKRQRKKEEYLKNKQQREEAIQRYKQKKMATYQMLKKKTRKGQPNLNLQMEHLLQKIQKTDK